MNSISNDLALEPLGAGDLIDRAVRLYRRHFLTLLRIAAPPVLVSAVGWTLITIASRALAVTSSEFEVLVYVLLMIGGVLIVGCGALFSLIVMGGATRNLVAHLLWNEPVAFGTTYRAVKSRFWGLFFASILVGLWLLFSMIVASMGYGFLSIVMVMAAALGSQISLWLSTLAIVISVMVAIGLALTLF